MGEIDILFGFDIHNFVFGILEIKKGDRIYDSRMDVFGVVKEADDIHNVFVEFEPDGSGLYCLDPSCSEYDSSLKLVINFETTGNT